MKTFAVRSVNLALYSLIAVSGANAQSFINLGFEQGNLVPAPESFQVVADAALPGWRVEHWTPLEGYFRPYYVGYNAYALGSAVAILHDRQSAHAAVLGGNHSLELQQAWPYRVSPSISQTASLPSWAYSLQYKTDVLSHGGSGVSDFEVTFDGQSLSRSLLESTTTYAIWAVDLAPVLGEYGELKFTGWGVLDDIQFSPLEVPEPAAWTILLLGGGVITRFRKRTGYQPKH